MWSSGRRVLHELVSAGSAAAAVRRFCLTPAQSTVIVERWWQVPLSKEGRPPRLYPRRHNVYRFVDDTKNTPRQEMELILTQTVPKLGGRGDTVFVKKSVGRNKLLPQGLAVYPSPENKQMFAEELRLLREGKPEDRIQTRTGEMTVNYLKSIKLQIHKMPAAGFQLTKASVCRHLHSKFLVVVPLHALNLPFEPIVDEGEYWCEVTVNGINTVRIPMTLLPYEDQSAQYKKQKKQQQLQQQEEVEQQQQEAELQVQQEQQQEEVEQQVEQQQDVELQVQEEVEQQQQEEAGLQVQQQQEQVEQQQQQEAEVSAEVKGEEEAAPPQHAVVSEESSHVSVSEETNSSPDTTAPPGGRPHKE